MIDTLHLLPPDLGPRSNPVLYGIAEAIAEMYPLSAVALRPCKDDSSDACAIEADEAPTDGVVGN